MSKRAKLYNELRADLIRHAFQLPDGLDGNADLASMTWGDLHAARSAIRKERERLRSEIGSLTHASDSQRGQIEALRKIEQCIDDEFSERDAHGIRDGADWNRRALAQANGRHINDGRILRSTDRLIDFVRSDPRQAEFNLGKFLRGIVTGDWSGATAERNMATNPDSAGGYLLPTAVSAEILDLARAKAVALLAGTQIFVMDEGHHRFPRQLTDAVAVWKEENAEGEFSDITFDAYELKAKTLVALVKSSIELWEDAAGTIDLFVRNALAESLAVQLDHAVLLGSGSGQEPRGITNATGVQEIEHGATLGDYSVFSRAVEKVRLVNGEANAAVVSPRDAGILDRLVDADGNPRQAPASYEDLTKFSTTQVPTDLGVGEDESVSIVGDFTQSFLGIRTNVRIEATRFSDDAFKRMQVWVRAYVRADTALARPNHFVKITGIQPEAAE